MAGAVAGHGVCVHGVCAAEPARAADRRPAVCRDLPPCGPGKRFELSFAYIRAAIKPQVPFDTALLGVCKCNVPFSRTTAQQDTAVLVTEQIANFLLPRSSWNFLLAIFPNMRASGIVSCFLEDGNETIAVYLALIRWKVARPVRFEFKFTFESILFRRFGRRSGTMRCGRRGVATSGFA